MITHDMNTAVIIGRLLLIIATVTATSFPVLYWFSPWYRSRLGQAIMLQAVTLALTIWLKFTLTFFLADGPKSFLQWTNVIVLFLVIVFTSTLTRLLWNIRQEAKRKGILYESVDPDRKYAVNQSPAE